MRGARARSMGHRCLRGGSVVRLPRPLVLDLVRRRGRHGGGGRDAARGAARRLRVRGLRLHGRGVVPGAAEPRGVARRHQRRRARVVVARGARRARRPVVHRRSAGLRRRAGPASRAGGVVRVVPGRAGARRARRRADRPNGLRHVPADDVHDRGVGPAPRRGHHGGDHVRARHRGHRPRGGGAWWTSSPRS